MTSLMFYLRTTGSEPCAQVDPELFFDEPKHYGSVTGPWLRALCESCPIFKECGIGATGCLECYNGCV